MRAWADAREDMKVIAAQPRHSVRMRVHQRFTLNRGMTSFLFRLIPGAPLEPLKRTKAPDLQRLGETFLDTG